MRARAAAVLVASICLTASAGCRAHPEARPTALPPPTYSIGEPRTGVLPVPAGMRLQAMQFADADHGYALEWSVQPVERVTIDANTYSERYRTLLFATADGGRTWTPRPLPAPVLDGPTLGVLGPQRIVISADGWYVSSDDGQTFRRYPADGPAPPEFQAAPGVHLWASGDCTPGPCFELIEQTAAGQQRRHKWTSSALPAPPEAASYGPDSRWWAFARDGGRIYAAVSTDRGVTWQAREVPAHPALASAPRQLGAQLSADGEDLWLLGLGGEPAVGGPGASAPRAGSQQIVESYGPYSDGFSPRSSEIEIRKPTDSPVYWLLRSDQGNQGGQGGQGDQGAQGDQPDKGDHWVPQLGQGRPSTGTRLGDTWAAIGGQMMIVAGDDGLGLLDDRWTPVTLPTRVDWVYQLHSGGVVAGARGEAVPAYFGTRDGRHVIWTPYALTQAR